ncbi:MAG TPA: transcription antitermination factor NusB [Bacteroidia bacterium]|nr:transcription antitermination factor NusB [Bacteroidia bacterium]
MLSRRHLRIRVMMALYAWYQSKDHDAAWYEAELFKGAERSYDLYLYLLNVLTDLSAEETRYYADLPPRHTIDENPVQSTLSDNIFIRWLTASPEYQKAIASRTLRQKDDVEMIRKLFHNVKVTDTYKKYTSVAQHTAEEDIELCQWLLGKHAGDSDFLQHYLEEKNLWWAESYDLVKSMVLKTIRVAHPEKKGAFKLMELFRDDEEDRAFMSQLLRTVMEHDKDLEEMISAKTKNWDYDRIALMDTILLKMALCEILYFQTIPVKVSINEYIDLSKDYSSPKSKMFINGILDKLVIEFKDTGKLNKTGRGLLN